MGGDKTEATTPKGYTKKVKNIGHLIQHQRNQRAQWVVDERRQRELRELNGYREREMELTGREREVWEKEESWRRMQDEREGMLSMWRAREQHWGAEKKIGEYKSKVKELEERCKQAEAKQQQSDKLTRRIDELDKEKESMLDEVERKERNMAGREKLMNEWKRKCVSEGEAVKIKISKVKNKEKRIQKDEDELRQLRKDLATRRDRLDEREAKIEKKEAEIRKTVKTKEKRTESKRKVGEIEVGENTNGQGVKSVKIRSKICMPERTERGVSEATSVAHEERGWRHERYPQKPTQ